MAPACRLTLGSEELATAQPITRWPDDIAQAIVHDQAVHTGVIDNEDQFLCGQAEVQRHENRYQRLRSEHGLQQSGMIEAKIAHAIAHANPGFA